MAYIVYPRHVLKDQAPSPACFFRPYREGERGIKNPQEI